MQPTALSHHVLMMNLYLPPPKVSLLTTAERLEDLGGDLAVSMVESVAIIISIGQFFSTHALAAFHLSLHS